MDFAFALTNIRLDEESYVEKMENDVVHQKHCQIFTRSPFRIFISQICINVNDGLVQEPKDNVLTACWSEFNHHLVPPLLLISWNQFEGCKYTSNQTAVFSI